MKWFVGASTFIRGSACEPRIVAACSGSADPVAPEAQADRAAGLLDVDRQPVLQDFDVALLDHASGDRAQRPHELAPVDLELGAGPARRLARADRRAGAARLQKRQHVAAQAVEKLVPGAE